VTAGLKCEIERSGVNYVLTRFAYGDLSLYESVQSLDLFVSKVMPEFAAQS
jgi:hypothetical protein